MGQQKCVHPFPTLSHFHWKWKVKAEVARSCPTLCDPIDYTVHRILQSRILQWGAFPFSRGSSQSRDQTQVSCIEGWFFTSWPQGKPKNTGVGSLSLLQGIFPTQQSIPGLPHCRWILYQLLHKGSPRILEWVAYPFIRGSSWHRNWTRVSCIAGRFFTNWAISSVQFSSVTQSCPTL